MFKIPSGDSSLLNKKIHRSSSCGQFQDSRRVNERGGSESREKRNERRKRGGRVVPDSLAAIFSRHFSTSSADSTPATAARNSSPHPSSSFLLLLDVFIVVEPPLVTTVTTNHTDSLWLIQSLIPPLFLPARDGSVSDDKADAPSLPLAIRRSLSSLRYYIIIRFSWNEKKKNFIFEHSRAFFPSSHIFLVYFELLKIVLSSKRESLFPEVTKRFDKVWKMGRYREHGASTHFTTDNRLTFNHDDSRQPWMIARRRMLSRLLFRAYRPCKKLIAICLV